MGVSVRTVAVLDIGYVRVAEDYRTHDRSVFMIDLGDVDGPEIVSTELELPPGHRWRVCAL